MDADGTSQQQLTDGPTDDFSASYSRDGARIVFSRSHDLEGVSHLWIMDADGTHQEQLTDGLWFDFSPVFSPDGARILFGRRNQIRPRLLPRVGPTTLRFPEIFITDLDGSDPRRLTRNLGWDGPVSFSSDGKQIFYYHEQDEPSRFRGISVMDVDGSNSRNLGEGSVPELSPDGRRIVQIITSDYRPTGVVLMSADGSGRRIIHRCDTVHTEPTFTPDGLHIVFVEWPEDRGAGSIVLLDLETSKLERVPKID